MSWIKIDDSLAFHPKISRLNDAQFRFYITALCYAGRHLTDGLVFIEALPRTHPSVIRKLVEVGLFEKTAKGLEIHDFLDFQRSRADVEALREKKREAGAKGGKRSAETRKQTAEHGAQADTQHAGSEKKYPEPRVQSQSKEREPSSLSSNGEVISEERKEGHASASRPSRALFTPPTVDEVRAYVAEHGWSFDPESFVAFYESKGWKVGGAAMKNWRAACVTWSKRDGRDGKSPRSTAPARIPGAPSRPPGVTAAPDGAWITYRGERFDRQPNFEKRGIAGWYRSAPNGLGEGGGFRLDGSHSSADAKWSPAQYVEFFRSNAIPGLQLPELVTAGGAA
jgi:hypothetical protein